MSEKLKTIQLVENIDGAPRPWPVRRRPGQEAAPGEARGGIEMPPPRLPVKGLPPKGRLPREGV